MTRHHEGVYECTANNGVGSKASSKINLKVLRKFIMNQNYPAITKMERAKIEIK